MRSSPARIKPVSPTINHLGYSKTFLKRQYRPAGRPRGFRSYEAEGLIERRECDDRRRSIFRSYITGEPCQVNPFCQPQLCNQLFEFRPQLAVTHDFGDQSG